ncbi:alpha/beta hydrolase [Alteraurantiacibacter palmitatis]|uniref:Alpha/beta hydrolase n=1 Tax=Alteraurantiacibacter palmitatis TaxID=2054628 RepID=A0ABV7E5K7_9SPHN
MTRTWTGLAVAAALLASPAVAQDNPAPEEDFAAMMARINLLPDTVGDGPYPSLIELSADLPDHVIYRPQDLSAVAPGTLGVFVWGNGGCAADGTSSRFHLSQIASYGYLVIAAGKWRSGPEAREGAEAPRAIGASPPPTTAAQLTQALDWALAENARAGSPLFGKINEDMLAAGGFSCGGVQALTVAGDPRLDTVVVQNSGLLPENGPRMGGMETGKDALAALHTPVIYLNGGESDIAFANGLDDVNRISHVPVAWVNTPTGHGGTYHEPMGGRNAMIVVDWLEWQLRGDSAAGRTFTGANCRLCTDPAATIEWRNFP